MAAPDVSTSISGSEYQHNQRNDDFELLDSVYFSAVTGEVEVFKQHEREINQILTPNGNTILHIYITNIGSVEYNSADHFVEAIIEMCPDLVCQANKEGETLLHFAARHGHADIAKFLLQEWRKHHNVESGIKPTRLMLEMVNGAKETALHEAVRYNHLNVVKVLLEEDSDLPYEANTAGETALYLAAERGFTEVVEEILKTCVSLADGGPNGRTALHAAVIRNDKEITEQLLAKETLSNSNSTQDEEGWTPLHHAAYLGYIEIAEMLLNKNKRAAYMGDNEGKIALHVAAAADNVKIVQKIIEKCPGCSELVDNRGWNAVHFSSLNDNGGAGESLLSSGIVRNLVNVRNNSNTFV